MSVSGPHIASLTTLLQLCESEKLQSSCIDIITLDYVFVEPDTLLGYRICRHSAVEIGLKHGSKTAWYRIAIDSAVELKGRARFCFDEACDFGIGIRNGTVDVFESRLAIHKDCYFCRWLSSGADHLDDRAWSVVENVRTCQIYQIELEDKACFKGQYGSRLSTDL